MIRMMYLVAGVIGVAFLIVCFLARDEPVTAGGGLLRPFFRIAAYLCRKIEKGRAPGQGMARVAQSLERLHPETPKTQLVRDYYVRKLAMSLAIVFGGTVFGCLLSVRAAVDSRLEGGIVRRGDFTQQPVDVELEGVFSEGRQRFQISVGTQVLTEEELEELFGKLCGELDRRILGDNSSAEEVTARLELAEEYAGYPFEIRWESSRPELLSADGVVEEVREEQKVILTARASCSEWERTHEIELRVVPPQLTPRQRVYREREQLLLASEEQSRTDDSWVLPEELLGQRVRWKKVVEDNGILLWSVSLCVAVLIFFLADRDLQTSMERRRQSMRRDYPEVVHKLVLFMGAGMTIRGSLMKIVEGQAKKGDRERSAHPIYEELLFACRELQTGTSESAAYDHLGKRCGVQEYIRLTTLLAQNLKKGNSALLQRLREEAVRSGELHLQYAKKQGEEAGTKLLVPMVMLLLVVMIILVLPAFWAVGI